jgi:L-threonylcarbamoyladenylate synthase
VTLTAADADRLERCLRAGGVAIFPADTVYGLACDPGIPEAAERLSALKGRTPGRPAAVLFFERAQAFAALPELGPRTHALLELLLPGGITALLPNPLHRFPLACGPDPETLGLRVPALPDALAALAAVHRPVLQSSANGTGGPDARRLADVPEALRTGADLVLDGGELAGTPSTVVDLRGFEAGDAWAIRRRGAVAAERVAAAAARVLPPED